MSSAPSPPRLKKRQRLLIWLRNSFLAGVAFVLPFVITAWLIWTIVSFIDGQIAAILPPKMRDVTAIAPGIGVLIAILTLTIVGALAGNMIGRFFLARSEKLIASFPIVRSIYGGSKQIFKQVAAPERTSFKQTVLVEFPRPGVWAIGFITNDETVEVTAPVRDDAGDELIAVYVPQAPIPTSGFLLYFPRRALKVLPIGPEEALKRVISLGIVKQEDGIIGK